jgi:hypothetical protein
VPFGAIVKPGFTPLNEFATPISGFFSFDTCGYIIIARSDSPFPMFPWRIGWFCNASHVSALEACMEQIPSIPSTSNSGEREWNRPIVVPAAKLGVGSRMPKGRGVGNIVGN